MPRTGGPRTTEGRRRASRNATTHGLYAAPDIVVGDERPGDWQQYHDDIVRDRQPHGALETTLASRVAVLLWRLRRLNREDAAAVTRRNEHQAAIEAAEARHAAARRARLQAPEDASNGAGAHEPATKITGFYTAALVPRPPSPIPALLPSERDLAILLRVEAHLNRQLMQTLHELEALQARRRGTATPLARVSINGFAGI